MSHTAHDREERAHRLEVLVFLLVLFPSMALPMLGLRAEELTFPLVAAAVIAHNVALMSLVLYFVWRGRESWAAIGWVGHNARRELLLGAALFVPYIVGVGLLEELLRRLGLSAPDGPPAFLLPEGVVQQLLAVVLVTAVAIGEETVFRGYLIRRFGTLTGSRAAAVLLSTAIFAIGHGYQGSLGIVAVAVIGIVFALIYFWRGSLIAPMVMHFLQDFVGILIAPRFLEY